MSATAADREMVLRAFGEAKVASVATPEPKAVAPIALIGNTWRKDAAKDAKSKEKEGETTPEVVDLASASDTAAKKAPEKKPEEKSENSVEYTKKGFAIPPELLRGLSKAFPAIMKQQALKRALGHMGRGAGIGAGAGAAYGALRPAEGEGRISSMLRRGALGSLVGGGIGGGRALGQTLPAIAPSLTKAVGTEGLKAAPAAGGVAGAGIGGLLGSLVSKAPKAPAKPATAEGSEEDKPEKPDDKQESAKAAAATLPAPGRPPVDKGSDDDKPPKDKKKPDSEPEESAGVAQQAPAPVPAGEPGLLGQDIPVLGPTGGVVLGGLEKLLGGLGWQGGQQKLQQWGQSPAARNIAGGTTATLAAIAAALAARKAFGRGQEDEGLYAEAGMKLDLVKTSLMGCSVPVPKDADGKNDQYGIPIRAGVTTTNRGATFDNLRRWSRGQ